MRPRLQCAIVRRVTQPADQAALERLRELLRRTRDEEAAKEKRGAQKRAAERAGLSEAQMSRILRGASVSPATCAHVVAKLGVVSPELASESNPWIALRVYDKAAAAADHDGEAKRSNEQMRKLAIELIELIDSGSSDHEEIARRARRLAWLCLAPA